MKCLLEFYSTSHNISGDTCLSEQSNDYLDQFKNLTSRYLNHQQEKYFHICLLLDSNYLIFLGKRRRCFV